MDVARDGIRSENYCAADVNHKLFQISQIQLPVAHSKGGLTKPLYLQPLLAVAIAPIIFPSLGGTGEIDDPLADRQMESGCGQCRNRPARQRRLGLGGDVVSMVGVHLDNLVGDVEVGTAAAHHQDQ